MAESRSLKVQYFAALREQRGLAEESLQSSAQTTAELYAELRARHRFTLEAPLVRAAVNGRMVAPSHPLAPGDSVVFLPPVAGG